jgi:hypothetical protein
MTICVALCKQKPLRCFKIEIRGITGILWTVQRNGVLHLRRYGSREVELTMTPHKLASKIRKLRARVPITSEFERLLTRRGIWNSSRVWYTSQKQHWLGWLSEYREPGYYGQGANCQGPTGRLSAIPNLAARSAAIRKIIPWAFVACTWERSAHHGQGFGTAQTALSATGVPTTAPLDRSSRWKWLRVSGPVSFT